MKTLNEYKLELEQIEADLRSMRALLVQEDRDPDEQERTQMVEMLDRADEIDKVMAAEERRVALEERFKDADEEEKKTAKAVKPEPEQKRTKVYTRHNKKVFSSLGEQLGAVMKAGMGERVDPRLYEVRAASGLSEGVGADGGFLLQPEYANELLRVAFDTGKLASRCRKMTLGGNSNSIKMFGVDETSRASTRWGGIVGYWKDEAALKTKSKPKFRRIELNLNKLIGLCYATDELLEDVGALEMYIRQGFAEEFGFQMDDAIINGTGAGRPLGIMNAGCMVQVSKEVGQAANSIIFENVAKMWSRLFANSQDNAVWLINQNVWPELFNLYLAVGAGGSAVFLPPGGLSQSPYSTLMGRPIIPIEQCQSLGTSGDIILADFNGYQLADKGAMQSDMSVHVRFIYDESVFRFVYRVDGQPILASPVTPYKGGANYTQSHFVKLQTRS
jgi:HK97 family phage major capsid protein